MPGLSLPLRSPSRIIDNAARSLTEPPGLRCSALAKTGTSAPVRCKRNRGVLPMLASIEPGAIVSSGSSRSIVGALISNPKSKTGRDFEKCDRLRRKLAGQWLAIASSACTRPLGRAAIAAAVTTETTHAGLEQHDGKNYRLGTIDCQARRFCLFRQFGV